MRNATIGQLTVSGLCLGGNPFSGFSHQSPERTAEMLEYFTPERIKETLRAAEAAGINTFFGRTDEHIMGILREYRAAGGAIQWFAQISADPVEEWEKWLRACLELEPAGAYIHGGIVDFWHANGLFDNFRKTVELLRRAGVAAGFAGHAPAAHAWIRDNVDCDFQMCSHYNPTDRSRAPAHNPEGEVWDDEAREAMLEVIATIERPVAHYKVLAAGNKAILPAFERLGRVMRPNDVAVVGIFPKDDPEMIAKDVALFERYVG